MSSKKGRVAKSPKRSGYLAHISAACSFLFRVVVRFSSPMQPLDMGGKERTATSMFIESIARRLTSGDHGRFPSGVFQPSLELTCSLLRSEVK